MNKTHPEYHRGEGLSGDRPRPMMAPALKAVRARSSAGVRRR